MRATRQEILDWVESAEYDFETAQAMLEVRRYNYCVLMCHQAVEKFLKALILLVCRQLPPRTHNLLTLLQMVEKDPPEEIKTILLRLNPHYTVARYPDMALGPSYKLYNQRIAQEFLEQTREVLEWLRRKMLSLK
ncbi:MAG: HEPN domain-containing protein [Candidatus Caldatribacteriaceae bacterium]